MSERGGAGGLAGRNDRPDPWSFAFPSGPWRALPVFGRFFRSPYGPRPLRLFGPGAHGQYVPGFSRWRSEMASREGLAVSCPGGSASGGTLMAVTWHVGPLALPARPSPAARGGSGPSGWTLGASRAWCHGCCRLDIAPGVPGPSRSGALRYTLLFSCRSNWAGASFRLAIRKSRLSKHLKKNFFSLKCR